MMGRIAALIIIENSDYQYEFSIKLLEFLPCGEMDYAASMAAISCGVSEGGCSIITRS
jgi:hypothetical protein